MSNAPNQPPSAEDYATALRVMSTVHAFQRAQETQKPGGYRPDRVSPLVAAIGTVKLYAEWWTPPEPRPQPRPPNRSQPPAGQGKKNRNRQHKGQRRA
ncbi:hypothetical protein [Arthrobacter rhombi]|uniref:hypothetical protein n=1 Tax=Arthrobacter rhombi TaxID=71253 RepID=UPI003FCFE6F1